MFVLFSCIFLSILHNIGLYFYTVKIQTGFRQNIAKNYKTKKYILLSCIRPSLSKIRKNHHIIFSYNKKKYFLACILVLITNLLKP
jgi:hypothetical protein